MAFRSDLEAMVLGVLQTEALHGYEIAKRIRELSKDAFRYGEGQLYPALHALERAGFVAAEWVPQEGKPARKVYAITESGKAELAKQRKQWEKFAHGVASILTPTRMEGQHG
jgi:PadR family transcriptional regulator, regulatory protein PadR